MNSLYGVECGLPARLDAPNHAISFDADTIAQALVNIYQKKYGNGKEIEPTLFEKTKEIFEGAINKGVKQSSFSIDTAFKHQLTHNMWVFSAFRTHKMQRDIAKYLLNEKGELKPFTKFVKDVAPYIKHTNRLWLETEYNTAVLRAHQAADWRKFVDERDVLPNLEWQPSTSTNPGEDHKPYWFTCLPIDHKFWKQHRPGDRWNCKCSLRNTDKEPTPVPADTIIKGSEPQRGLESNPGEKGEIFSNSHPYYPENCGKCPFNKGVGKLWAALVGGKKKHCGNCKSLEKATEYAEWEYTISQSKEANRKIFNKLNQDSSYVNVEYNEETGAIKATHRGHAKHRNDNKKYFGELTGDDLEDILMELMFSNGHSVIFCDESKKNKKGDVLSSLDMFLDGVRMDIKSITQNNKVGYGTALLSKNAQLRKFNARTDIKEKADTVCLFFYDPNYYGEKKIKNGIKYLKEKSHEIQLKHIVCVLHIGNGRIKTFEYDI